MLSLSCDSFVKIFFCLGEQIFFERFFNRSAMLVLCQFGQRFRKSEIIFPNNGSVMFSFFRRKRSISWVHSKACRSLAVFPSELVIQMDII